jgi:hypothetical protein
MVHGEDVLTMQQNSEKMKLFDFLFECRGVAPGKPVAW